MTKKRTREYEDFQELGAYLAVARTALMKAFLVAANDMYPKNSKQARTFESLIKTIDAVRSDIENRWPKELTSTEDLGDPAEDLTYRNVDPKLRHSPVTSRPENLPEVLQPAFAALSDFRDEHRRRRDAKTGRRHR